MKTALLQLCCSDDPRDNLVQTQGLISKAASDGAQFVLTPEVTNCVSTSRAHQQSVLATEDEDMTLVALRQQASELKIWLLIGSIALKTNEKDGRFANRSFLISPDGRICAKYDKIHMFDVKVSETETYCESAGYRPGDCAVTCDTPFGRVGMTVCYDLRFPTLYRQLAHAGADFLTIPSAFSPVTGRAHWEILLRARAIETGCYVLAPAQKGEHKSTVGQSRKTYGHSMVVGPWGDVLADAGTDVGVVQVEIDKTAVSKARKRIPSLTCETRFSGPK
ncbi:carbon-nitrogen hydrolase family protein [Roseovarius rhodophyticola]|uniref:Carbon-nitrogen hydrolase family protein n=1 Tax=Roseovarius rhodophyticola TaxID=3080827 RepID=A0ABZ2TNM5_9RHOB|nr:carbon-nitrogen hydrolase family protein [Roseovarius sp. W115]MDV2930096.1 carbon-nitrogen hydrolase family protein [Roseovarius sp. W115]